MSPIPLPAPIVAAYRQAGALDINCPHCGADPGSYCTRDDGRLRRTPCVARCRSSSVTSESLDVAGAPNPAACHSAPVRVIERQGYTDPSEPRYPRGDSQ